MQRCDRRWQWQQIEPLLWSELLPFTQLQPQDGVEALAEYVVWKEPETKGEARLSWLTAKVQEGVRLAENAGLSESVESAKAMEEGFLRAWVQLL